MRDAVINKTMTFINDGSYSKTDLEKIKYGLECLYIFITKGVVIFIFAYLLGIFKYTFTFVVLFGFIRTTACGLHATKSWICMLSSLIIFIIIPFLCKLIVIPFLIRISIMIISTILIYIYAPADTKKRPIINKKKRLILKSISIFISIIYILLSIYIDKNFILNALLFSLILETTLILPITYKLFKLPYNNYIEYLKSERRV